MVAESWNSPEDWYKTNVVSQVKLHDELRKLNQIEKYIHISTPEVYPEQTHRVLACVLSEMQQKKTISFALFVPYF